MFLEPGDCIDIKKIVVAYNDEIQLSNFYNASKALVQFYINKADVSPDPDNSIYDSIVISPVALICEHFLKKAFNPQLEGILMNQYGIYELIGVNNISNTTIRNLLPNGYNLNLRVSYYK